MPIKPQKIIFIALALLMLLNCGTSLAMPKNKTDEHTPADDILPAEENHRQYISEKTDELINGILAGEASLVGFTIGIDPGHQSAADHSLETIAPSSQLTKEKQSTGTQGARTGAAEHTINMMIARRLYYLLRLAGADVVMTRTSSAVNISNIERAQLMNDGSVDFWIRLHCECAANAKDSGCTILIPAPIEQGYIPAATADDGTLAAAHMRQEEKDERAGESVKMQTDPMGNNPDEEPFFQNTPTEEILSDTELANIESTISFLPIDYEKTEIAAACGKGKDLTEAYEELSKCQNSLALGAAVLRGFCRITQAQPLGVVALCDQTGFNFSVSPVISIEMGRLSNPDEDLLLTRPYYQNACACGIFAGILDYCNALSQNAASTQSADISNDEKTNSD